MNENVKKAGKVGGIWATSVLVIGAIIMALLSKHCTPPPPPPPNNVLITAATGIPCGFRNDTLYPQKQVISFQAALLDQFNEVRAMIFTDAITLVVQHRESQPMYRSWHGVVKDSANSYFMFVKRDSTLSGVLGYGGRSFAVKPCANGTYSLAEIDPTTLPRNTNDGQSNSAAAPPPAHCEEFALGESYRIDLMVLYTEAARGGAASAAGVPANDIVGAQLAIEAEIAMALEVSNMAFARSELPFRLQLAYVGMMGRNDYTESHNDFSGALRTLGSSSKVRTLRDQYAADLVCMFVEIGSECGRANYYRDYGSINSNDAFSVVRRDCAINDYTLAHEIGHNLGLDHECENSSKPGVGHGYLYKKPPLQYVGTMMTDQDNYKRLPFFSDIAQNCGKNPVAGNCGANEVAVLPNNVREVANYRCAGIVDDVWINDNFEDTGDEPNQSINTSKVMVSPNLWVRRKPDPYLTKMYQHKNATGGKNYLYVKIKNGSNIPQRGLLKVYRRGASLQWKPLPSDIVYPSQDSITLPPQGTMVVEVPFDCPLIPSHYSYALEWSAKGDPLTNPQCINIFDCVTTNNNMAAKCLANIYLQPYAGKQGGGQKVAQPQVAASATATAELLFDAGIHDLISIQLELNDSGKTFTMAGGGVQIVFDSTRIILDSAGVPMDTKLLPLNERPGVLYRIVDNQEIWIPEWVPTGEREEPTKLYILFDVGDIRIPGSYTIHVRQSGGSGTTGSYSYQIIVGGDPDE